MPQPEGHLPQVVKKKEGHMPELRKRRTHLALLGAFAMVASVLAAGTSPVSAVPGTEDAKATYSACIGPATGDAGYTDVATGSTHDAAINCIAYYGITRGTTATTFAPEETISRWQLAVMLKRAAGPAGAELVTPRNQGYTDISGLSSSFQDAINQMAADGIMRGTSSTTFSPDASVTRAVIVEALAGFLTKARIGPGGKALSRDVNGRYTVKQDGAPNAMAITVDENFRDIGGVTFAEYEAIRALAEMGVVAGRGDGTFGPAALVTRAQAASFITRALAHTNTRPAGLNVQASKAMVPANEAVELSISLRDGDFAPMPSEPSDIVDIFSHTVKNAGRAFNTDGTCASSRVTAIAFGATACLIELSDEVIESDGNLTVDGIDISEATTFWVWTGDNGQKLDWDSDDLSRDNSDVSDAASVTVGTTAAATSASVSLSVSPDADGGNTVRYGTTVTVTIQLLDARMQPIGIAGQSYQWSATGTHNPTGADRIIPGTGTRVITTDANGRASFTLTQSDPDAVPGPVPAGVTGNAAANDITTWAYTISPGAGAIRLSSNPANGFDGTRGTVIFDDDISKAHKVSAETQRMYTVIPATATSGTPYRVAVTGKVTDQYGNNMRGEPLFFDLDGDTQFGCTTARPACAAAQTTITTAANGRESILGTTTRITRSSGTNRETATYTVMANNPAPRRAEYVVAADINGDGDVADANEQASAYHIWVAPPPGYNAETGIAPPHDQPRQMVGVDLATNTILRTHIVQAPGPDGQLNTADDTYIISPDYANAWNYTDDSRFRLFNATAQWGYSIQTWVNGAEFENRWRRYIEWCLTDATCMTEWTKVNNDVYVYTPVVTNTTQIALTRAASFVEHYDTSEGGLIIHEVSFGSSNVGSLFPPPSN